MSETVYVNGKFVPAEEAAISVFDHGLLYGDGVFEGIRFYKKNIFRLEEHVERLYDSARYILLDIGCEPQEMMDLVVETCRRNNLEDGYIRLVITRGAGTLGLNPRLCGKPGIIVIVSKVQLYPEEYYRDGLSIITASTRRTPAYSVSPRVKSLNYLNNILAKMEAVDSGALEALMLDANGYIVECTGDNFFLVKKGELFTPPTHMGSLRGITRNAVIELAKEQGIHVREEPLTLHEAYTADECFLTGTAAEIIPVISIDKRPIGNARPGRMTHQLLAEFRKITTTDGVKF